MIISRLLLVTVRYVSDESCTENLNKHIMLNNLSSKIVPFMK